MQSIVNKEYAQYVAELKKVAKKALETSPYMFGYPLNLKDVAKLHEV